MNKWGVRVAGILMLIAFALVFMHLQRQLLLLQQTRNPQPAATTTR